MIGQRRDGTPMDIYEESLEFHKTLGGKLEIAPRAPIQNRKDLSLQYTPGVARPCEEIARNPSSVYDLTIKRNTVAVVTDGSAVLGLGNIGAHASIPVMEGKAVLFKEYSGLDAFPICIQTQDVSEIIRIVRNIAPVFGGINLEDISAPRCFEIESALQDIGIPVFHDDQHGTAIVLYAALLNAAKLANKKFSELKIVINGSGAAGTAIAYMLLAVGFDPSKCEAVADVIACDTQGIINRSREDIRLNPAKAKLAIVTNVRQLSGKLEDAMKDADVFIGVSAANRVSPDMVKSMAKDPLIFAMANPIPEIMPDLAKEAGAFIVGTGRSDLPNQVNNVLAFPGIFRGAIDARAPRITNRMKLAAAHALAEAVKELTVDNVIPSALDKSAAKAVASAVKAEWELEKTES